MALDELHARRLATIASIFESALDRMGLVLKSLEALEGNAAAPIKVEQIQLAREKMESIRAKLREALKRFAVRPTRPEPRQALAAELSALWLVLENAMPARMKGYGRDFSPDDKKEWEQLIRSLLHDLQRIRDLTRTGRDPHRQAPSPLAGQHD
jgi:hypothetical protein